MLSRREFTASIVGAAVASTRAAQAASAQTDGRQAPRTANAGGVDGLAALTLAEASARLRAGTVSSTDLVNACLARIDVYNPKVNAFITVTPL